MKRIVFAAALWSLSSTCSASEAQNAPKADAAYIILDVENLDDAMMQGTSMPGTITLGRYDSEKKDIRGGELSPDTVLPNKQSSHLVVTQKPVVKTKVSRQYIVEIQPDTWVVEGANGTAFSLGSFQFTLHPGQVIDLGIMKPAMDWAEGEGAVSAGKVMMGAIFFGRMKPKNDRPVRLSWHARRAGDLPLPTQFSGRNVELVSFEKGATFGNYLGGLVNRVGGRTDRAVAPTETTPSAKSEQISPESPAPAPPPVGSH